MNEPQLQYCPILLYFCVHARLAEWQTRWTEDSFHHPEPCPFLSDNDRHSSHFWLSPTVTKDGFARPWSRERSEFGPRRTAIVKIDTKLDQMEKAIPSVPDGTQQSVLAMTFRSPKSSVSHASAS
jgi:hypothetical protein